MHATTPGLEAPARGGAARARRAGWIAFKLALTLALIWVVLRQVSPGALGATLASMGFGAVALCVAATLASVLVSSLRWLRVLAALGERVGFRALFADNLVGTTYNLLLPTSVGGDVARAMRCARRVGRTEHAWASVLFERIVGLLSLVLISMVGLLSGLDAATHGLLVASGLMLVTLAGALVFMPAPLRLAARLSRLGARRVANALERLALAFAGPLSRPRPRLEALGWSLLYQLVALSILVPAGMGWDEPALLQGIFLGVPVALVASTLPITIGGFGLRESLFIVVLSPFGIAPDRALALSLVWVASNVLVGVLGLGALLKEGA